MALTELQITKIRKNWNNISRLGLPLFVITRGTVLLAWMCLCFVGFTYLYGTQRLLHNSFVIETTLPCMAIFSYICVLSYYWIVRSSVRRIGAEA